VGSISVSKTDWMRGTSPLKGAVLGLLLERPSHGYELANRLSVRLGPAWQISPAHVYPLLDQIERAGLVRRVAQPSRGARGRYRTVYYPTEQAPEALALWMKTAAPKEPLRVELQAKISVARVDDAPQLLALLDRYERECLELLEATIEEEPPVRSWATLLTSLSREAADVHLNAELVWVARARRRIEEYAAYSPCP
jgi:DNA-binding PadR family transcriptional regulator